MKTARSVSMQTFVVLVKTWTDAWATSRRYKEGILWSCVFGCEEAIDELPHYVRCSSLWKEVPVVFPEAQIEHIANRILLHNPSKQNASTLVSVFHAYHSLRHHGAFARTPAAVRLRLRASAAASAGQ